MKSKQNVGICSLDFPVANDFVGLDLVGSAFAKGSKKSKKNYSR